MVRTCPLALHQGFPYASEVSSTPSFLVRDPLATYRRTTTAAQSLSIGEPIMIHDPFHVPRSSDHRSRPRARPIQTCRRLLCETQWVRLSSLPTDKPETEPAGDMVCYS